MRNLKKLVAVFLAAIMLVLNFNVVFAEGEDGSSSEEDFVYAFIERLYVNMMGRDSDEGGREFWANQIKGGYISGNDTADHFYYSAEFQSISANIDNNEFVERMYITLLGRSSDPDGLGYWTSLLNNNSYTRDEIYGFFLGSAEWRNICETNNIKPVFLVGEGFLNDLYLTVFNRAADEGGKVFWSDRLKNGQETAITVAYQFFFGYEYASLKKSDEDFIRDLYKAMMGREADDSGLSYWVSQLSAGNTRLTVFNNFALTDEFASVCSKYNVTRGEAIKERAKYTICIDPGHSAVMPSGTCPLGPGSSQGKPADAVGTHGSASGLMEYQLTLSISMQLRDELVARGYNVIMTRTDSDKAYDLVYRASVANNGADLMVRIHADGLTNTSVTGCSAITITPNNPWNPQTYSDSRRLADCLLNSYVPQTGIKNRGVVEEDTMAGNNWSTVPCVLFELGFMTNRDEDLKMADPTFQATMVKGLADGIDSYYGF